MSRAEAGKALFNLGIASACGAGAGLFAKDRGITVSGIWIVASLVVALFGIFYSMRTEKMERAEAWEQEIRVKRKIEAILSKEEKEEEGRLKAEGLRLLLNWLSSRNKPDETPAEANQRASEPPKVDPMLIRIDDKAGGDMTPWSSRHHEKNTMKFMDKIAIAFGLAYGLVGCSATTLSAAEPAAHSLDRWGDIASERQLCERMGGVGCAACAGTPDEAACYRQSYRLVVQRRSDHAANPFDPDTSDPFEPEESPAPDSPELGEQIREGIATDAIHHVEQHLSTMVQP
jgi:hypothetical protein